MIESAIQCPRPQLQQSSDPHTPPHSPVSSSAALNFASSFITSSNEDMHGDPALLIIPSQHGYDQCTAAANCADIYEIKNADFSRLAGLLAAAVLVLVARPGRYSGASQYTPSPACTASYTNSLLLDSKQSNKSNNLTNYANRITHNMPGHGDYWSSHEAQLT